jgi:hypothetical protein
VRAALQGVSAAAGKLGAVAADVAFGYVGVREAFYLSAASGVAGALVTLALLPDTTGLSLDELDRLVRFVFWGGGVTQVLLPWRSPPFPLPFMPTTTPPPTHPLIIS